MSGLEVVGIIAMVCVAIAVIVGVCVLVKTVDKHGDSLVNQRENSRMNYDYLNKRYWELYHRIEALEKQPVAPQED
jgi:hypothetical protein